MINTLLHEKYKILKQLGVGGFGSTYLAEDTKNPNCLCAIKKLNPDHAHIKTAKRLFKREAQALASLTQVEQIPKFIDYFEDDNNSYIVEEYIKGIPLDKLLDRRWDWQIVIIFIWEISSILQLLHEKNIVHRDIKPANLIQRNKDSKLTIIDFGAVKEVAAKEKVAAKEVEPGTAIFNYGYSPPEQINGTPGLNSDIYSLGMTAYHLLTGMHPRNLSRDRQDNIIWSETNNCPQYLKDIINKMVKTDCQERYQSVAEILRAIRNHPPDDPSPPPPPPPKNRKLGYLVLIVGILIIVSTEFFNPWIRPYYFIHQGNRELDGARADYARADKALQLFNQAIKLNENIAAAWKGKGDVLLMEGRYPGALSAYQEARSYQRDNTNILNSIGQVYSLEEKHDKALTTYEESLNINDNNAEAWSGKGFAHFYMMEYEESLEAFDQAQKFKRTDPNVWLHKGIASKRLDREKDAQQFFKEALHEFKANESQMGKDPLFWTERGYALLQLNNSIDALDSFNKALEIKENFRDALDSFNKALEINENFYEALLGKAKVLTSSSFNEHQNALTYYDLAKAIRPSDYQVWWNRGQLLQQQLNDHDEAILSFNEVINLKEDFYPAWLRRGLSLLSLKKYPEALNSLDRAKDLNAQDPFIWVNRGLVLKELGQNKEALASYEQAIKLGYSKAIEYRDQLLLEM